VTVGNYDRDIGEIFATLKAILGGIDEIKSNALGHEARLRSLEDSKARQVGALSLIAIAETALNLYLLFRPGH
jgi:hypothetical protein